MRAGWFTLVLGLAAGGCTTPALTADDATPYQACTAQTDCVIDVLDCNDCSSVVSVAADQQVAFDQFRGCWPGTATDSCPTCTVTACSGGICVVDCSSTGGTH